LVHLKADNKTEASAAFVKLYEKTLSDALRKALRKTEGRDTGRVGGDVEDRIDGVFDAAEIHYWKPEPKYDPGTLDTFTETRKSAS
jgi:hypothetical protein